MPKVLIIGPTYFNFLEAVSSAFAQLGWESEAEPFDVPVHPYNALMKCRWKIARDRASILAQSRSRFRAAAESHFDRYRPDLVFILNGDMLEPETLDRWRSRDCKVALWLFDNIVRLPRAETLSRHADQTFSFDQDDADTLDAIFLPQACDTDIYKPLGLSRDIDILFVGNLWTSPRRKELTAKVIDAFPDRKIEVWGLYQPWYKGLAKWMKRPCRDIYKNRNLAPAAVNERYNRSKVVLNIHQEFQTDGANPRVFEICGSGAYQVCDSNPYVSGLFPQGSVALYHTEEEMISAIAKALENSETLQNSAKAARDTVLAGHTFVTRIRTVLDALELSVK